MRCTSDLILVALGVLLAATSTLQRSTSDTPSYTAAVVEYNPDLTGTAAEVFEKNVDRYVKLIEQAANASNEADIIVFPECGLASLYFRTYSRVPEPSSLVKPCNDTSGAFVDLRRISCAAEQHRIYVVINLYEAFPCDNATTSNYNETCPEKGAFYYNTDVVFDRQGSVVARYRKFNLFGEAGIGTPPSADLVTFNTDFGVTFGLFTCFDLMFEGPAVRLVREKNVTDIIFPTAWFSELPFLTAVQAQAAWAHGMDVNFLGSGYNDPDVGSGGSGIYLGRQGPLETVMPSTPLTKMIVGVVPKKTVAIPARHTLPTRGAGMLMKRDNLTAYSTHLLDVGVAGTFSHQLCHGDFCCSFAVSVKPRTASSDDVAYSYRLVVFNGIRSFDDVANGFMQVCALVSCTDTTLDSCGLDFSNATYVTPTVFRLIRVQGVFKRAGTQLPNTLTAGYLPLPPDNYIMMTLPHDADDLVTGEMILLKEASPLTFGIFGRDFSRDSEHAGGGAGVATSLSGVVVLLLLASHILY